MLHHLAKTFDPLPPIQPAPTLIDKLFAVENAPTVHPSVLEIIFAILFSFALNSLIAWVYKLTYRGNKYSQDYVHSLLILGTVVTMVIMVVHGDRNMAFGMFAAFSIIRFRRTVNQARDIGFIFLAMATGLAIGAQQYLLALITVPLVCLIIWAMSFRDLFLTQRDSHLLRIRINNDINYTTGFAPVFEKFLLNHELASVETVQAGMMTELLYEVTLKDPATLNEFVEGLQLANGNNRILLTKITEQSVQESE
jgi:hypothetical protein